MNIQSFAAVFVCLLLGTFVVAPVAAEGESESPQFLLLKNGQVIECEIDHEASSEHNLVIKKKSGSRIHFNRNKIVSVAESRSAIYWEKYALLSPTDSIGHLRLFEWCLAHKLLDSAQNQIELLQFMDVNPDRMLALVDKLDEATMKHTKQLLAEKFATKLLPKPAPVDAEGNEDLGESKASSQVQQVGYEAPVEISDRLKLIDRLERTTESIGGQAVVMFKRKIEPLLINSCYTAKCHSSDTMPLPLATLGKNQRIPKRMSQRNLYNVLKFTNFDRPLESKLLSAAALPHAGQTSPIIKINSRQFQNLRVWLVGISSTPFIYHPVPDVFLESDTKVAVDAKLETSDAAPDEPAKAPQLDAAKKIPSTEKVHKNTATEKHGAVRPDTKQNSNAKDPFDPDLFNRLYLEKRKTITMESSECDPDPNK